MVNTRGLLARLTLRRQEIPVAVQWLYNELSALLATRLRRRRVASVSLQNFRRHRTARYNTIATDTRMNTKRVVEESRTCAGMKSGSAKYTIDIRTSRQTAASPTRQCGSRR
jgi:hypothetical protein